MPGPLDEPRDAGGRWTAGGEAGVQKVVRAVPTRSSVASVELLTKRLETQYPGAVVQLSERTRNDAYGRKIWHLDAVVVPKESRGQGMGSAIMKDLVAAADKAGAHLTLLPSTDFGASSVPRLRRFYSQFGFRRNFGARSDPSLPMGMFREPTKQKP